MAAAADIQRLAPAEVAKADLVLAVVDNPINAGISSMAWAAMHRAISFRCRCSTANIRRIRRPYAASPLPMIRARTAATMAARHRSSMRRISTV
ncbi:MAG: hypothetical protein LKE51_00630 [Selenomonas sp.]|nr:hypothetical protein [Selenomonas sp.]